MTNLERIRRTAEAEISRERRALGAASPEAFAKLYLGHHMPLPASPMHRELFDLLAAATQQRGVRIAVAAPRGHAKSTVVSLCYVLWSALYSHETFIWIISSTVQQAEQLLRSVKDEIETNALLAKDFPELTGLAARGRRPSPWRGTALLLPNGVALRGMGLDQQLRGMKHRQNRPSLIILDDAESPEQVQSEEQRMKLREHFERTILKAGDVKTNILIIGTVLHHDSLLARYTAHLPPPGWTGRRFQALQAWPLHMDLWAKWTVIYSGNDSWKDQTGVDAAKAFLEAHRDAMHEGSSVLWPEKDSLEVLMEMRVREGDASFHAEKQNEPLDPALCVFKRNATCYWDDQYADIQALRQAYGKELEFYGAWDPGLGANPARGDYSAIIIVAYVPRLDTRYVLVDDIARRTPDEAIQKIVEYARLYPMPLFAVEANGFQSMVIQNLDHALDRARIKLRLVPVHHSESKRTRISMLEPRITHGSIRFHRHQRLLLEQLWLFPHGKHDDGPDALEMACRLWDDPRDYFHLVDLHTGEWTRL